VPEFLTRTVVCALPTSITWAGVALSATGGRPALAPAEAGTSARTTGTMNLRELGPIIARWP
jgi:hypothetical protein